MPDGDGGRWRGLSLEPDGRRWLALFGAALVTHLLLSLNFPYAGWTTSTGVGLCLLVALAYCLRQTLRAASGMRWRWAVLSLAFLFWIGAYAAIAYYECFYPPDAPHPPLDELAYALRAAPYLLLLARAGDGDEGRAFRWIDSAQALLFSTLVITLLSTMLAGEPSPWTDAVSLYYSDAQNFTLAALSLLGLMEQPTAERRRFARGLSALLVSNVLITMPFNHFVLWGKNPPPGSPADMVADVPLLIMMLCALIRDRGVVRAAQVGAYSLLQLLLPAAFCAASIALAFVLASVFPLIGVAGAALALLLKSMRSALLQSRLRSLQRFIADVVERLPDAVCVVGSDGVVSLGNDAATQLFGADPRGAQLEALLAGLARHAGGDEGAIEMLDGRTLVVAQAPLDNGETIVRLTDVTRLRGIERDREEALQFLSHDIRSPQAAILLLLDRHLGETQPAGLAQDVVDRIRRHARHGLRMADDFVRLARVRSAMIADDPVDVGDAVAEAADMVWPLARERGVLLVDETDGGLGELWVRGERALIIRAVHNLLENGIKFAPSGSKLRHRLSIENGRVRIRVLNEGEELPTDRQRDPFSRFGSGRPGLGFDSVGLGLAFVRATARRHLGEVHYDWQDGQHIFAIDIPQYLME